MPDKVLKKFPKVRFFLAGACPLRDDGYAMAFKLVKLGIDTKVTEFKNLPHAFLNFDILPFLAGEAKMAIERIAQDMRKMIDKDEDFLEPKIDEVIEDEDTCQEGN